MGTLYTLLGSLRLESILMDSSPAVRRLQGSGIQTDRSIWERQFLLGSRILLGSGLEVVSIQIRRNIDLLYMLRSLLVGMLHVCC